MHRDCAINIIIDRPSEEQPNGYIAASFIYKKPRGEDGQMGDRFVDGYLSQETIDLVKAELDIVMHRVLTSEVL